MDAIGRARLGVFGIFWLSGLTVALWGAALPAVNERLDLGEARVGTVLLVTGAGALLGPALAPSYPALLATTFVFAAAGSAGAGVGRALSRVTTFGYVGMLAGPAVIGRSPKPRRWAWRWYCPGC